jgi:hypothetical protein
MIFSSMAIAFTSQRISAFGPLPAVAIMFMTIGGLFALATRELFYVPADSQWDILVVSSPRLDLSVMSD